MRRFTTLALAAAVLLTLASRSRAEQVFRDDFTTDPTSRGWRIFGDADLFQWDAAHQELEATWDSSRTNSYFYRPLGTVLTRQDDFSLAFDLRLRDLAIGTTPGKEFTFQLAVGLLNGHDAAQPNFLRGTGTNSPNVVEFDYFPDSGFGATISPTVISSNGVFATSFNSPLALDANALFHITLQYSVSNQTLVTTMTKDGSPFGPIAGVALTNEVFTDFRVDRFAVASYSDFGQDPNWDGSILAHGSVDNVAWAVPDPPVAAVAGSVQDGRWWVDFDSHPDWVYTLEATQDFLTWREASAPTPGVSGRLSLTDVEPMSAGMLYRVRAERP